MPVADLRINYSNEPLKKDPVDPLDPMPLFSRWMEEASQVPEEIDPNAMCLCTVDESNCPSARMVLLKGFDDRGFVWCTNYTSRKGSQLAQNPNAALTFWWSTLQRSVRVEGIVRKVDASESDAYFNSRPIGNRLGAIASDQSQPLSDPALLQSRWKKLNEDYLDKDGNLRKPLERPENWGGYRLVAHRIEFWKGKPQRLHDRIVYQRSKSYNSGGMDKWKMMRLQP